MNEKRFTIHKESKYKEEWYAYPFCIKEDGEVVFDTIPLSIAEQVRDKLNEQQSEISKLKSAIVLYEYQLKVQDRTIEDLEENIQELEEKINKLPPKIRELWIQE